MGTPTLRALRGFAVLACLAHAATASEPTGSDRDAGRVAIALRGSPPGFEVTGLTPDQEVRLRAFVDRKDDWTELFPVSVGTEETSERLPMFGKYALTERGVRFEPRFPLVPGQTYTAVFRPDRLGGDRAAAVSQEFQVTPLAAGEPTSVVQVYPTRAVLPENLLKFYVRFSAPMSRGRSYEHLHLLDERGAEIDLPFLELGEELWNSDETRLTVLFDPGRIKRGVKPQQDIGAALTEGRPYTFVVDADWRDAAGQPLKSRFRKVFNVGPPDYVQPNAKNWAVTAPQAGSTEPLVVRFDEPLDHAMLQHVLTVQDGAGASISGAVAVEDEERRWRFRPEKPWQPGDYRLVVATTLEDSAGNSLGRPFEVDLTQPAAAAIPDTTALTFTIAPPGPSASSPSDAARSAIAVADSARHSGAPFDGSLEETIRTANDSMDVWKLVSPHTLLEVELNPEMRVKVAPGSAKARLHPGRPHAFFLRVDNACGATARLALGATDLAGSTTVAPNWLDVRIVDDERCSDRLSGAAVEYKLVICTVKEPGRREVRLGVDAGQGTQDLGFRGVADVLFDVRPDAAALSER